MNDKPILTPALRSLIAGACIVVITAGMKVAAPVLNILLLAFLLAQSVLPFPIWLIRKRFKPGTAVILTIAVLLFGGLMLMSLLGASISDLIQKLPVYQEKLGGLRDRIMMTLAARGVDIAKLAPFDVLPPKTIIGLFGGMLGALAGAMGNGFILLLVTIFALIELVMLQTRLNRGEFPDDSMMHRFEEISKDTRKYVAITGIAGFAQAAINTGVLMALGVDFAVTFGVFFFLCNFIPAVGFFVAIVPPFFIALLDQGLARAFYVLVGWWIVNFIFDNIIRPKFMKKGLNIPIFLIIAGLMIWAWVLGPVGAILAIPLTMAVIRLVQYARKTPQAQAETAGEK